MSREVPPLLTHIFKDTGREVKIRKLSPFMQDDVMANLRKADRKAGTYPIAPMVPGVEGKLEPNEADPDYNTAKIKYERDLRQRTQDVLLKLAIRRGVEVELTDEIQKEVADLKADYEITGVELEEADDKELYVTRICLGSTGDLSELYDALFKRSLPSREEIEDIKATFPSDVSG